MRDTSNRLLVITGTDRRRRARLRASNMASAAVVALTVLGAFVLVPAPRAVADFSPQEQQIANELPAGFASGSCTTAANPPPPGNALASLDCRAYSGPDAPTNGRFTLFADPVAMGMLFQNNSNAGSQFVPTPCTGTDSSPVSWSYTDTPDQSEGYIFCGTFQGLADVEWTRSSQSLILDVLGSSDVNSLYRWWARNGNPRPQQGPVPNAAIKANI